MHCAKDPCRHHCLPCPSYSLTTATYRKRQLFHSLALSRRVVSEMKKLHDADQLTSLAWVIMPTHVHWLVTLKPHQSIERLIDQFRSTSAQSINQCLCECGPIWDKAYSRQTIKHDEDLRKVARFIVSTPLRAGLVDKIGNYPLWDAAWL